MKLDRLRHLLGDGWQPLERVVQEGAGVGGQVRAVTTSSRAGAAARRSEASCSALALTPASFARGRHQASVASVAGSIVFLC